MERTGDARALERLAFAVFGAKRHQAGHFRLGDVKLLAAECGEVDILDDVIGGHVAFPVPGRRAQAQGRPIF